MKYQIAPIWFSNFLENDNVFLTKRDTRWRKVQLNRSIKLVRATLLANTVMAFARKHLIVS